MFVNITNTENSPPNNLGRAKIKLNQLVSDSTSDFAGAQATSASVYMAGFPVNNSFYATDISFPGSVGTSVGMGNFDTKANTFSAEITFCHNGTSFVLSESQHSLFYQIKYKKASSCEQKIRRFSQILRNNLKKIMFTKNLRRHKGSLALPLL